MKTNIELIKRQIELVKMVLNYMKALKVVYDPDGEKYETELQLESELSALIEAEKQEPEEKLSEDDIWKNLFNDLSIPDFYWNDILSGYKKKYKLTVNSSSKQELEEKPATTGYCVCLDDSSSKQENKKFDVTEMRKCADGE